MTDAISGIVELPLFSKLNVDERSSIARSLQTRTYPAGHTLFRVGDAADYMYLVRRGQVRLYVLTDTGDRIDVGRVGPGEHFGEVALLCESGRTAAAETAEETEFELLGREDLLAVIEKHPRIAIQMMTVLARQLRSSGELLRRSACRNANIEHAEHLSFGDRLADRVASFGGSWAFIITFMGILLAWMTVNALLLAHRPFDPYPFILLNLVLSTVAAIQAPVIMMSQNRQGEKDRLKSDLDYEVNVRAEQEIAHLHSKIDELYESMKAYFDRTDEAAGGRHRARDAMVPADREAATTQRA
jgi:uncharacterized membrane protein